MGRAPLGAALTAAHEELVAAAKEYCRLYERAGALDAAAFPEGLERVLPRLQAAGVSSSFRDERDELPEDDLDVRLTVEERQAADVPVHAL